MLNVFVGPPWRKTGPARNRFSDYQLPPVYVSGQISRDGVLDAALLLEASNPSLTTITTAVSVNGAAEMLQNTHKRAGYHRDNNDTLQLSRITDNVT